MGNSRPAGRTSSPRSGGGGGKYGKKPLEDRVRLGPGERVFVDAVLEHGLDNRRAVVKALGIDEVEWLRLYRSPTVCRELARVSLKESSGARVKWQAAVELGKHVNFRLLLDPSTPAATLHKVATWWIEKGQEYKFATVGDGEVSTDTPEEIARRLLLESRDEGGESGEN